MPPVFRLQFEFFARPAGGISRTGIMMMVMMMMMVMVMVMMMGVMVW